MPVVKIGASRQLTVPKELHKRLGLKPGDILDVELKEGKLVYTPKTLVDKQIEARLEEGLEDIRQGRIYGPFNSAEDLVESLHKTTKTEES